MLLYFCQIKLKKYEKVIYKIKVKTREREKGHHEEKLQSRKLCYDSEPN